MIVTYADEVYDELREIWLYNVKQRGLERATEYEEFLVQGMAGLADAHAEGKPMQGFPNLLSTTFRKSPRGDGHIAVYEVDHDTETVNVLHVFHTKQDVRGRLGGER